MKKLICVVLALLFVASTAFAETFSIRDGITWSSTPEEITALIGTEPEVAEADDYNLTRYYYLDVSVAGITGTFAVTYIDGQPITFMYFLDDVDENALADALSEKYTSAEASSEILNDHLNAMDVMMGRDDGYEYDDVYDYIFRWTAEENTDIFMVPEGSGSTIMILYFNMNALESQTPVYTTDGL